MAALELIQLHYLVVVVDGRRGGEAPGVVHCGNWSGRRTFPHAKQLTIAQFASTKDARACFQSFCECTTKQQRIDRLVEAADLMATQVRIKVARRVGGYATPMLSNCEETTGHGHNGGN